MAETNIFDGFISAPIKLAAEITSKRSRANADDTVSINKSATLSPGFTCIYSPNDTPSNAYHNSRKQQSAMHCDIWRRRTGKRCSLTSLGKFALLGLLALFTGSNITGSAADNQLLRHKTHYMNLVPSAYFSYTEGRQTGSGSSSNYAGSLESSSVPTGNKATGQVSHIHKRSSALLSSSPALVSYSPLVSSSSGFMASLTPRGPALRRRMMSGEQPILRWQEANPSTSESIQRELDTSAEQQARSADWGQSVTSGQRKTRQSLGVSVAAPVALNPKMEEQAELLLRQKQHIQYHDQWWPAGGSVDLKASMSSLAPSSRCHKRTLNFCASVLPFNTTTFPNIIGDNNRFEVKRSLPFFGFLAKSSCNKRLDELLCLLLEPPCNAASGVAIPPCKKFCRLALEGCNEYIPATLAMSLVFDCRQYPDSNDPNVCINLAQGSKCANDEFKCPDKTCIPKNWLCDGVRDCIFAADEANCTAGIGQFEVQNSVCSTEEFKCDGKCVPKAWRCDGERDCSDGTDEEACDKRPRCALDRFKCSDGNGCIPKRWVCDGKAECRDGSDELNCEARDCSESDFKCASNGVCIPKIWRCDRQADCKDGSDELNCLSYSQTHNHLINSILVK